MAIKIIAPFEYQGKQYLDSARRSFDTIAAMKSYSEDNLPDGYITYCKQDGNDYQYDSSNAVDELTGRWRLKPKVVILTSTQWEQIKDTITDEDRVIRMVTN